MPISAWIAIGVLGIYLMLRGQRAEQRQRELPPGPPLTSQDGDAATLDELAHAGSDLSREHTIEFYLYVPEEDDAQSIATDLRHEGMTVEVTRAADNSSWLCLIQRKMIPDMAGLRGFRERFTALAAAHNGEYDGWGTEVEA